ncbi:hypothetical protein ACFQO1_02305 [Jejudonia soesokkakensis]|uniref:Uncharacterized protein n=1 Tax=Jejudonia soesokkakensis TaxID=1323432 RepID=A0ABW2MNM8_9FLAO
MRKLVTTFAALALIVSISSCRETTEEKAEDTVESAAQDAENNLERAGDEIENAADNAGQEIDEEINNTDDVNGDDD